MTDLSTLGVWWTANAMNSRGQVTQETSEQFVGSAQIVSNRIYDAVTGWLTTTRSGVGGGAALQRGIPL
jgi:hypothetical protein